MMNKIKLKPCPLCGTEAYSRIVSASNDTLNGYISCNNSQCKLKMDFTIKTKYSLEFDDVINGINDAVNRWNNRVSEDTDYDINDVGGNDENDEFITVDLTENKNNFHVSEVVYTKSDKYVLDIGLVENLNPFRVYARHSKYNEYGRSYYGNSSVVNWYGTGIYKTYNEWEDLTMNGGETRSTEEICNILGISYGVKRG